MGNNGNGIATGVTVGTFDGMHRGHKAVIAKLMSESRARCLEPVAVTFDRHPLATIAPERAPRLLSSPARKNRMLRAEGVGVMEMAFDKEAASMTTREFMRNLRDSLNTRLMIVGYDNTFGSDGVMKNIEDYVAIGKEEGIEVLEAPVVAGVSSSSVRRAIAAGDLRSASRMLGRDYTIEGMVVHGHAVGRTIGFPTANIRTDYPAQLPSNGVYISEAVMEGGETVRGVVNIGMRPTLGNAPEPQVEAHLLDFADDLYGRKLTLRFLSRLRDEKRFESLEMLKKAIADDAEAARRYGSLLTEF